MCLNSSSSSSGLETISQLIVSFPPQRTGKVEERAGNARRAPADERGIIPDHPLDGPRRHMPPSSCFSRFDFRELEHLLFHGACRHARARVGGAGACCGCPIESGGFACAPAWLLWREWRSRQGAQPLLRATRAPSFRDFLTHAPCVFTGVQGAKLGQVGG